MINLKKFTEKKSIEKYFNIIFIIIAVIAAAMYLLLAGNKTIWYDESYTMAMIRRGYADICKITAADNHPPLYYIALKGFISAFGESMLAARIFSVIPYMIILTAGGISIKKLFGEKTAALFMLLFILYPFQLTYSIEIRMYSLAALFVFFNAAFAYRCFLFGKPFDWIAFTLFGACAAYTHYFAMASAGIVYIILFIAVMTKKSGLWKAWLLCSVVTAALYLPWLKYFIEQLAYKINNEYWIEPITIRTILSYGYNIFKAQGILLFPIFYFIACLVLTVLFIRTKDSQTKTAAFLSLAVPIGTIIIGVAASILVRPVFVIRYVVSSIPLFVVFTAIALSRIDNRIFISSFLTLTIIGGLNNYATVFVEKYFKTQNRIDERLIQKYSDCDGYIIGLTGEGETSHFSGIFAYYERDKTIYIKDRKTPDNPFENIGYIGDFNASEHNKLVLLVDSGAKAPQEFTETYNCEYKEKIFTTGFTADLYLLTR